MKVDLNINLFNSRKAGNCDSENLVFHINFFYTRRSMSSESPQKRQIGINSEYVDFPPTE